MELEKFKALHKQQLRYERLIAEERVRTDSWINGLTEASLREQIVCRATRGKGTSEWWC